MRNIYSVLTFTFTLQISHFRRRPYSKRFRLHLKSLHLDSHKFTSLPVFIKDRAIIKLTENGCIHTSKFIHSEDCGSIFTFFNITDLLQKVHGRNTKISYMRSQQTVKEL